ncbi:MAG: DUF6531 domain-containing protein, partial [Oscillospiraceae bacterium]|nr:DUF6531 domain-containing protein [Oscillospiraceae bacterium]
MKTMKTLRTYKSMRKLRRMVSLILCIAMLTQSVVSVLAHPALPPPAEWNFIQLSAQGSNEVLSVASGVTTMPEIAVNRAFNPIAERAEVSFAFAYAQGARIEVYRLASGVNPEEIYQAGNPLGTFVGYMFGEFDGVERVFDFSGFAPMFDIVSPGALSLTEPEPEPESEPESDLESYPEPDQGIEPEHLEPEHNPGLESYSPPGFDLYIATESLGGVVASFYEEDMDLGYTFPEEIHFEEFSYDIAIPAMLDAFFAFRGYSGWLPELLYYDPLGLVDPSFVPTPDNFVNTILWEGLVVDNSGQPVPLTNGNYVIVVQPVAASQANNRILLPISIDHDYVPVITGMPRSNTTPFETFSGIPGLHEVNMISGNYFYSITDLIVPVNPALGFTRNYNAQASHVSGHMGNGWRTGFDIDLEASTFGATITMPDGGVRHFTRCVEGFYSAPQAVDFTLEATGVGWVMTDRSRTRYYFNSAGNIIEIVPLNGERVSFFYTGNQLTEVRNRGGSLTFSYVNERIATVTAIPGFRSISFEYDAFGNLISVTDYAGRITTYGYDASNRLVSMTDTNGWNFLNLAYDSHNRLIAARIGSATETSTVRYGVLYSVSTDHLGISRKYNFDRDRHVTSIEHHDGTEYFEFRDGRLISETARNGRRIRYEHDDRGNITRIIGPDGGESVFTFNANNLPTRIDRTNPQGVTTTRIYEYDARGNVIRFTDENGHTRTFTYDQYNRLITSTDADGNTTSFTYDEYGRMNSITTPDGGTISTEYDSRGNPIRITSAMNCTTTFEYNAAGHMISTTDPLGNTTQYEVDANGNITAVIDPLGNRIETIFNAASQPLVITDQLGFRTIHTYNADGNLLSTTFPDGGVIRYTYDMYGRLESKTDARGNTWTFSYDSEWRQDGISGPLGQSFSVTFDERGNMVTFTNGRNQTTRSQYNADNRVSQTTDPEGGITRFEYDSRGNLTARIDPNGNRWEYAYDSGDRLILMRDPLGNETHYVYDGNGRLIEVRSPMSNTGRFVYDLDGRLTTVTDAENNIIRYEHNCNGLITRIIYPDGTYTSFIYDAASRL